MKRVGQWMVIFWMGGCATVDATGEGEPEDEGVSGTGGGGSGGQSMGSGGLVLAMGSGGTAMAGDGDGDTGGVVIGGDGDGDTGGGLIGDGDTGGGLIGDGDTGGMLGDGDTGGTTSTGGAADPGTPAGCLLDWDTTTEGDDCLNAGQADWESGCTNLLDCWQMNDCSPTECSSAPDATCGQNVIMNATPGMSYAEGVYEALCL